MLFRSYPVKGLRVQDIFWCLTWSNLRLTLCELMKYSTSCSCYCCFDTGNGFQVKRHFMSAIRSTHMQFLQWASGMRQTMVRGTSPMFATNEHKNHCFNSHDQGNTLYQHLRTFVYLSGENVSPSDLSKRLAHTGQWSRGGPLNKPVTNVRQIKVLKDAR